MVPFLRHLQAQGVDTLDAVQPAHIRRWLLDRRQAGIAPQTLANSYRIPRVYWNWCLREGLTENDPFKRVPKPKANPRVKPALSEQELTAILKACEGTDWLSLRNRALVLVLLDTGMRLGEAQRLKVEDAKRERLIICGKGEKERMAFLSVETRLALKRYLKACPHPLRDSEPLWQGIQGALTLDGLKLLLKRLGQRAGVPLGAHKLRRTFATWSLRNGIDLERLRLLMGHSDYATLRRYLALVESDLKRAHAEHSPLTILRRKPRE